MHKHLYELSRVADLKEPSYLLYMGERFVLGDVRLPSYVVVAEIHKEILKILDERLFETYVSSKHERVPKKLLHEQGDSMPGEERS